MEIKYLEAIPAVEKYMNLIESTGWQGILENGPVRLNQAITNSWYAISAYHGDELIGSGRIISDGILHALICDLIVLPAYQGKGIGSCILRKMLDKCQEHRILMVQLFAAKGKYDYYKRFGFEERPSDSPGMRWVNRNRIDGNCRENIDT